MNETLEYIDDYFTGALPVAERAAFENRITADENFAQEVAFYLNSRQALRQTLLQQKQQEWKQAEPANEAAPAPVVQLKQVNNRKKMLAVAASLLIVFSSSLFVIFISRKTPQSMASQYVKKNFSQLSASMDGSRDSIQLGIAAYNAKNYEEAEKLFTGVFASHPENTDALTNSGLVSLVQEDYDKAISRFQMLAGHTELYANPGNFYQAIALLKRSKNGDKERAKALLQAVVDKNAEGSPEAKEWLKKF